MRNPDPHSRGFEPAPKPDGWVGGSDDFTFLGFGGGPGRIGLNEHMEHGEWDPCGYQKRQNPANRCLFDEPMSMSPDSASAWD